MKRLFFLSIIACFAFGLNALMTGCSDRPNFPTGPSTVYDTTFVPQPGDTIHDTTFVPQPGDTIHDTTTVIVHDSLPPDTVFHYVYVTDTVFVIKYIQGDTIVDTIYIHDQTPADTIIFIGNPCGQIHASFKTFEVPLINSAGEYTLMVHMTADNPKPQQVVTVSVNGHEIEQMAVTGDDYTEIPVTLSENSIIEFDVNVPPTAAGHAIHICIALEAR